MIVTDIKHIGKERDVLNEPFGLDKFIYEFYDDSDRIDQVFRENSENILSLKSKYAEDVGIARTILWAIKEKIKDNDYDKITDKIKIKILSLLKK